MRVGMFAVLEFLVALTATWTIAFTAVPTPRRDDLLEHFPDTLADCKMLGGVNSDPIGLGISGEIMFESWGLKFFFVYRSGLWNFTAVFEGMQKLDAHWSHRISHGR